MKMEGLESSETSALKAQTPGDYPKKHNASFNTRLKFEINTKNAFLYDLIGSDDGCNT